MTDNPITLAAPARRPALLLILTSDMHCLVYVHMISLYCIRLELKLSLLCLLVENVVETKYITIFG